jgi:hypothetical protein
MDEKSNVRVVDLSTERWKSIVAVLGEDAVDADILRRVMEEQTRVLQLLKDDLSMLRERVDLVSGGVAEQLALLESLEALVSQVLNMNGKPS